MTRRLARPGVVAALATALYAACQGSPAIAPRPDGGGGELAPRYVTPPGLEGLTQVLWVGDILLGETMQPYLEAEGYGYPFVRIRPRLIADHLVGNAEGPLTLLQDPFDPTARFSYDVDPASAEALARVGFTALSLANNHTFDRGAQGLLDTIHHIRAAGIQAFGAGASVDEAMEPALLPSPHGTIAVVGFTARWPTGQVAEADVPGTLRYGAEEIARAYDRATALGARWVVAYLHWGNTYTPIEDRQRTVARQLAATGYALAVGHHPHVPQPIEIVDGMPVAYSVGNFAFGSWGRFTDEYPGRGLLLRTYFGPAGVVALRVECVLTDNREVEFQTRLCAAEQAAEVLGSLGPLVRNKGGIGAVDL